MTHDGHLAGRPVGQSAWPFHERVTALSQALPVASVQGTLALDLHPRLDPPAADPAPGGSTGDVVAIELPVRHQLERWSRRYVQAAVEIVGGDRPVSQLVRWTVPSVYDDLARRALLVARAGDHYPGLGRGALVRPQVRGVRLCFLARDVVEAGVHVRYGQRSRAIAARFEVITDRWQCSALEFA